MGLAAVQGGLAQLLLKDGDAAEFHSGRKSYAAKQGLRGRDAALLASLEADDVTFFARHRRIDRAAMLGADMPRACALLGPSGLHAYFARFPYAFDHPVREATRLAAWCARYEAASATPIGDVARFEVTELRLAKLQHRSAPPSVRPRRAPGVVALHLRHRVDATPVRAVRNGAFYAVAREPDGVTWCRFGRIEYALLRLADGRRTEQAWLAAAAREASTDGSRAQAAAATLRDAGLLRPRQTRLG